MRTVLACIVGIIVGSIANMAIIMLSWVLYPPPKDLDPYNAEAMSAYVESLPFAALLLIIVAHAGGALIGGMVGGLIAGKGHFIAGVVVGAFFLFGGIMNAFMIPAPVWFLVVDLVSYIPSGILGALLGSKLIGSRDQAKIS